MQTYHPLLVIFSCLKVHSISGSQHTDYCLSLRDAGAGTAADHTDCEDRCMGSLFPTVGNPVPDAWEPYSQPVGNRLYAVWNCPHEGFHHEKAAMNPHEKAFSHLLGAIGEQPAEPCRAGEKTETGQIKSTISKHL
ncbi:hypothetical protein [Prevotella denticola]|nr:hypothetical protein [Prevotella denticola]